MGGGWWDGEGYPDLGRVERRSEPTAAPRHVHPRRHEPRRTPSPEHLCPWRVAEVGGGQCGFRTARSSEQRVVSPGALTGLPSPEPR